MLKLEGGEIFVERELDAWLTEKMVPKKLLISPIFATVPSPIPPQTETVFNVYTVRMHIFDLFLIHLHICRYFSARMKRMWV
jgi:hypothetical protein